MSDHDEIKLRDEWMKQANECRTVDDLTGFLKMLSEFPHDYRTIARAVGIAGVAASKTLDRCAEHGGITGFQAGCAMWDFIEGWGVVEDGPKRLTPFQNMLYPQYESHFTTIPGDTWKWIQKEAKERLEQADEHTHESVRNHWESITNGVVPFGYRVEG